MIHPQAHLCLVSAQSVPNITPVLDSRLRPSEVILLVSPDMRQRAEWLKKVLLPKGIKVTTWPIDNAWDITHVQDRVLELLAEREGQSIALNATGGTKPMSIAAYEVFRSQDLPAFYVHPERDQLIWLHQKGETLDLEHSIKLEAFLQSYGAECEGLERGGIGEDHRQLVDELVRDIDKNTMPLRGLNWLAQQAERSLSAKLETKSWMGVEFLAERFELYNLLQLRGDNIRFPNEAARFFVNGGWFESYVFSQLFNLRKDKPGITDLARNIRVVRHAQKGDARNEIDLAFLANNSLYLIECKTRGWGKDEGLGAEALYKLDTLKDLLGGLQAKAMLVSYQPLNDATKTRAQDLRIATCDGAQIKQLRQRLHDWITPAP